MKDNNILVDSKKIGESLKRIRLTHNLSQKEFANILNVSSLLVSKWENGERTPRIETFKKINKIYGITFEEITTGSFKPKLSKRKALKYFLNFNIVKTLIIITIIMIMFLGALIENQTKIFNLGLETNNININKGTLIISDDYFFNIEEIDNSKIINHNILVNFYILNNKKELVYSCLLNKNTCNTNFKSNIISKEDILNNLDSIYVELIDNNEATSDKLQLTLLSNSQELRNLVEIPDKLLEKPEKEKELDNCLKVNKKELIGKIEKYNKMFKVDNKLFIVRKANDYYIIFNDNKYITITTINDDIYGGTDGVIDWFIVNRNNKLCIEKDNKYYTMIKSIIDYYK